MAFQLGEKAVPLRLTGCLFLRSGNHNSRNVILDAFFAHDTDDFEDKFSFFEENFLSASLHDLLIDVCDDRDQKVHEDNRVRKNNQKPEHPDEILGGQRQMSVAVNIEITQTGPDQPKEVCEEPDLSVSSLFSIISFVKMETQSRLDEHKNDDQRQEKDQKGHQLYKHIHKHAHNETNAVSDPQSGH